MFSKPKYDLSILIPARNEMFLAKTVENLLANIRGNTEIIVGLDGQWADPGVQDDPRVTIVYYPESIGQRAMTNQLARMSTAKYVAKTDAHCAFDDGFDVKLLEAIKDHDDWTIVPTMRNLHAFDWVCKKCKNRWYQGPTPTVCRADYNGKIANEKCTGTEFERDLVWRGKPKPESYSYKFDTTLHFQYFNDFSTRVEGVGNITESMSLQGSFFMMTREKYWELNICDEKTGSWGQQGVEVACKTWLSGGKVMVLHSTWYAHLFRTQGGDFGFPYPQSSGAVEKARQYSRDIWLNNKFEKQIYPLSWLIERFKPLNSLNGKFVDWHDEGGKEMLARVNDEGQKFAASQGKTKGIIYFTDNRLNMRIAREVRHQIRKQGLPIVSASLKPMDFGKNIHLPLERGYLTMFKQILAALEASDADIIFFCEHDVLYHRSHFDFTPPEKGVIWYNINVWKLRLTDGMALWVDNCRQVSGLSGYREDLIAHYRERVALVEREGFNRNLGFEPGTHGRVQWKHPLKAESRMSEYPNVDIRHDKNLTANRWSPDLFRDKRNCEGWKETYNLPGWGEMSQIVNAVTKNEKNT